MAQTPPQTTQPDMFNHLGQIDHKHEVYDIIGEFTLKMGNLLKSLDLEPPQIAMVETFSNRMISGTFAQHVLAKRLVMTREAEGWYELNDAEKAMAPQTGPTSISGKIKAIRMLRERKHAGLKDAKAAVDRYLERLDWK